MFAPAVEFIDAEIVLPPPVKKQVWDGEKFVPITIYKIKGLLVMEAEYKKLLDTLEHTEMEVTEIIVEPATLL